MRQGKIVPDIRKNNGFIRSKDYINLYERDLSEAEVQLFKKLSNLFIKVKDNIEGRIYELKHNSFKKSYVLLPHMTFKL